LKTSKHFSGSNSTARIISKMLSNRIKELRHKKLTKKWKTQLNKNYEIVTPFSFFIYSTIKEMQPKLPAKGRQFHIFIAYFSSGQPFNNKNLKWKVRFKNRLKIQTSSMLQSECQEWISHQDWFHCFKLIKSEFSFFGWNSNCYAPLYYW